MNIAFYMDHPYWGQLNNNGGTRTILKSAKTLRDFGCRVDVVAKKDHFTWFDHPKPKRTIPYYADVVVAVSISDVGVLNKLPIRAKLFYWARPIEFWQLTEDKCISRLRKFAKRGRILVNSEWQHEWLKSHRIPSKIIYFGIDIDFWYDMNLRKEGKIVVGTLYSDKPRKRW